MELGTYKNFIAGNWTDGCALDSFTVVNPATEAIIAQVPNATAEDVRVAIDAAASALPSWADTIASDRAKILHKAAAAMRQQTETLARVMTMEEGKPLAEARGEIAYAASFLEWFAEEAVRVYGDVVPSASPDKRIVVIKRPIGITAAITPWNFPAAMIARKLGPALAAGCTMIVKPSELTPLSALQIARLFEEAGLPKGVLSVVAGRDAAALTRPIMEDFRVRKVSFTGSTAVGKILIRQSADTVKRLSLELGGHAPFLVFEDADIEDAVENALVAKMRGMGETCVAANRFYVQRSLVHDFTERLSERMSMLQVGNGLDAGVNVGPLIQAAAVDKVDAHVSDAVSKGATAIVGGLRLAGPGFFYQPTVLANVDDRMLVTQEETFGPVAAVIPFDTEEEVVRSANQTQYGLAAYCFTRDVGRIFRLAERLEYGIIGVNDGLPSTAQAPFGGIKSSGLGREGSRYGISEYLDLKYLSLGGILR